MQDGKALQAGTSHFLGQNFAKAFDVKFVNKENEQEYAWATSWGVTTRLIGALIMAHSDDKGLVLPPKLAPYQLVIIPIYRTPEDLESIKTKLLPLLDELKAAGITFKLDDDDSQRSGWKFAEYELKGVPLRLAIGMRDIEAGTVELARRDTLTKETRPIDGIVAFIGSLLEEIQANIFKKALDFREQNTYRVDSWDEFQVQIEKGGFILAHWDGTASTEEKIKETTKATIRCIPANAPVEEGKCIFSGGPSMRRVVFARAY